MELDPLDGIATMTQPHDLAVLGPGGDLERVGHGLAHHRQRVVARGDEGVAEPGEYAAAVVADRGRLAVHLRLRARDRRAVRLADRLVAEADAEDRRGRAEPLDDLQRHARLIRIARAGGDHDALGTLGDDRVAADRVVAHDLQRRTQLAEVLDEVVREGVVVVDDEDHRSVPAARRSARIMPRALEHVSSHSVFGSESATMPAPTCTEARRPWQTTVRIVMQESRFPE